MYSYQYVWNIISMRNIYINLSKYYKKIISKLNLVHGISNLKLFKMSYMYGKETKTVINYSSTIWKVTKKELLQWKCSFKIIIFKDY